MNRANMMVSLVSIVIGLSLLGVIVWQQFEIVKLNGQNEELLRGNDELTNTIAELEDRYESLNESYHELLRRYNLLTKYFFIQDPWFNTPLNETICWGVEAWNRNPDSVCEIKNGFLHLFYNGTIDWSYGNSGVFQGRHTDGRSTNKSLLVGNSPEDAFSGDYVIIPENMQSGEFWLKTKFRIIKMGFNRYPSVYHTNYSRVNLGITLMCAIDDAPFNLEAQTLWLDTYFGGYCLNTTYIWTVPKNWSYVNYSGDIFAGYFVDEISPQNLGQWIELSIDLGDYISKTLNLITQVDIKTIRVYGFILFVEALGAYAEVEYDYVETCRVQLFHES